MIEIQIDAHFDRGAQLGRMCRTILESTTGGLEEHAEHRAGATHSQEGRYDTNGGAGDIWCTKLGNP